MIHRFYAALAVVALVVSCTVKTKQATVVKNPKNLGIHSKWVDLHVGLPAKQPAMAGRGGLTNPSAGTIAIVGATVLTAAGKRFNNGTIVLSGGTIQYVGDTRPPLPSDALIIDGKGKFVTPGLIDIHSHIGLAGLPETSSQSDTNEMISPSTPDARALYAIHPQDPAITRARAGGVTTALVLPGSANLIGGLGQTIVMKPGVKVRDIAFTGAPRTIKMACGENPKTVYGKKGGPQTRMGEYAMFRQLFQKALEYDRANREYRHKRALWKRRSNKAAELESNRHPSIPGEVAPSAPALNPRLEVLSAVLRGEFLVQVHCYRASEIAEMIAIADEFGFKISAFHHALEAYKVRKLLAAKGIAVATWADWWGFKMEAFDGIPENAAMVAAAGASAIIHSDSPQDIQHLNQETSKAYHAGLAAGITLTEDDALRWITANPAKAIGLEDIIGTLQVGKRSDVVIWNHHPFSVYALADLVIQAGEVTYVRSRGRSPTDFEIGNHSSRPVKGIQ